MVEDCGAARMTIFAALSRLAREGFIESRGRAGIFVVGMPAHLKDIALVFRGDPDSLMGPWLGHHRALTRVAKKFEAKTRRKVQPFYDVDKNMKTGDFARLAELMQAQRIAGVIFANVPLSTVHESPVLDLPGIPRVAFHGSDTPENVVSIHLDYGNWYHEAMQYIATQGCKSVGFIGHGLNTRRMEHALTAMRRHGLRHESRWVQMPAMGVYEAAAHLAELMMADRNRPDALLITDDNFTEAVLEGLHRAKVKMPHDLVVVSHANFPSPPKVSRGVTLLGYDATETFSEAVQIIDTWRKTGKKPKRDITIPARWGTQKKAL